MQPYEVLRFVVDNMQKYQRPAIRSALTERGVSLELIEQAISEAERLAKQARDTGQPIDLGEPEEPAGRWPKAVFLAIAAAAAAVAALKFLR